MTRQSVKIVLLKCRPTLPRFLPIITEIRLSLRSLSSFFCFSFRIFAFSFANSFSDFSASLDLCLSVGDSFESVFSACKLLLELDPFNNEGSPRLNTEDFFCAEPGVDCEEELGSLGGEELALTPRTCEDDDILGESDLGNVADNGICMD